MTETKQILNDNKVLVVVPTYNNAGTLAKIVENIRQYSDHILVVNDGSTDTTGTIIESLSCPNVCYSPNKGKGYAIRQAFEYANSNGYQYVLTIDADGQHYASNITTFANELVKHPETLIIGARNLQADNMPSKNTFANRFSNFWYRVETGKKLEDTQSGFRLYPMHKLRNIRFFSNKYEFEVESIVRATWKGVKVINIPVNVYYPPEEERVSHFKPFKDFTRISILNSILVTIALLYYYPWRFFNSLTRKNIKRFIENNITKTKDSNHKIASAIGLGVFFGIVPIWGYQMLVAAFVAHLLKINKVLTLISSNISIPPMIPFILYGSFYTGALLLGRDTSLNLSSISFNEVYKDLFQYIYGAVVFAMVCGIIGYLFSHVALLLFRNKKNG